jgi:hypothetical protein
MQKKGRGKLKKRKESWKKNEKMKKQNRGMHCGLLL